METMLQNIHTSLAPLIRGALKIIAILSMVADHCAYFLMEAGHSNV